MPFDRKIFFDSVRDSLFGGRMSQEQVDGMSFKLDVWEQTAEWDDLRHLAYAFATSFHETGQRMVPVREGFCATDAEARAYVKKQGYPYAAVDPVTGNVFYGRGDIQTTWAENYQKTTSELGLSGDNDLYWHPDRILDPSISASALYQGMYEGWYRGDSQGRQTFNRYFDSDTDDPYGAREIVNGDKSKVPSWSNGVSIGNLIKGYHQKFLAAMKASWSDAPTPAPTPEPEPEIPTVDIVTTGKIVVTINGEQVA